MIEFFDVIYVYSKRHQSGTKPREQKQKKCTSNGGKREGKMC